MSEPAPWPDGAYIRRAHWHFHSRLYERYNGLVLDHGGFSDILRQIKEGHAIPLGRNGFSVVVRRHGKAARDVYVVAFPERNDLVTVRHPRHGMNEAIKNARAEKRWPDPGFPRLLLHWEMANAERQMDPPNALA